MRTAALLTCALATACNSSSETVSESLSVIIGFSNPSDHNAPQTIWVTVTLNTTTQYSNSYSSSRSSRLVQRSPASATLRSSPVVPDALSLTLDGQPVPCSPDGCAYYWDTSKYPDGQHVFRATARYKALSGSDTLTWTLDR